MAIHQKLQAKLSQKLILTPSLQQAIKLLPMSTLELADMLNQEVVENPLLEEIPSEDLQAAEAQPATDKADEQDAQRATEGKTDNWEDNDYEYFFNDYMDDSYRSRVPTEVKELPPIENTLSTSSSLTDHLEWQLSLKTDDLDDRAIGTAIIGNLDDDGILVASVSEIAQMGPWDIDRVEQGLRLVQTFDPTGVAARDLQECLTLQLRQLGLEGTPTERIVTEHLRLLQNHQIPELSRKMGLSIDELREHIEVIRHLDPKPGARYNARSPEYVMPDVYIVKVDDQYVAVLNDDGLPQLRISSSYKRLLDKDQADADTRTYVKERFNAARWLLKSVEQRQKTIQKVATSIINFQRDFLDHGIEHLRPLVLRDVANDIGMHESTVSRVVTNKYMHTPQGVFEMKYFFHSGISSSFGDAVSSVTIKQRIRKIIEAEDARKPLSDSKIVSILQREGLVLARRTIAKYREELRIPTSNQRKVLYQPRLMPPTPVVTVGSLLRSRQDVPGLPLELVAGAAGLDREITSPYIQKTGLALAGYHEYLRPGRVLIYGDSEVRYLQGLAPAARLDALARSFASGIPCVLATTTLPLPPEVAGAADTAGVPLLRTTVSTPVAIGKLTAILEDYLASREVVHGVLMDVLGLGVLLVGESGIGKSECALDLVTRGHRLVADDSVEVRRRAETVIIGTAPGPTRYFMEIRGLGLINIRDLFGVAATRSSKRVEFVVELQRWDTARDYDRLGLDDAHHDLLGLQIPKVTMPVAPGRSVAILVEVAARNQLLRARGVHAARAFVEALDQRLERVGAGLEDADDGLDIDGGGAA